MKAERNEAERLSVWEKVVLGLACVCALILTLRYVTERWW
jgi:cell division protein FtsL